MCQNFRNADAREVVKCVRAVSCETFLDKPDFVTEWLCTYSETWPTPDMPTLLPMCGQKTGVRSEWR